MQEKIRKIRALLKNEYKQRTPSKGTYSKKQRDVIVLFKNVLITYLDESSSNQPVEVWASINTKHDEVLGEWSSDNKVQQQLVTLFIVAFNEANNSSEESRYIPEDL